MRTILRPRPVHPYRPVDLQLRVPASAVTATLELLCRAGRRESGVFWYGSRDYVGNGEVAYVVAPRQRMSGETMRYQARLWRKSSTACSTARNRSRRSIVTQVREWNIRIWIGWPAAAARYLWSFRCMDETRGNGFRLAWGYINGRTTIGTSSTPVLPGDG